MALGGVDARHGILDHPFKVHHVKEVVLLSRFHPRDGEGILREIDQFVGLIDDHLEIFGKAFLVHCIRTPEKGLRGQHHARQGRTEVV